MNREETLSFLSRVNVFEGMADRDLKLLYDLCEEGSFSANEVLIEEGEVGPPFQIVVEGLVRVMLPTESRFTNVKRASEVTLNTLSRGRCFGEYSLLDDMPASASVAGVGSGKLLLIPFRSLHNLLASDDRLGKQVFRNMLVALVGRLKRRESDLDRSIVV